MFNWLIKLHANTEVKEEETASFISDFFVKLGPNLAGNYIKHYDYMDIETLIQEVIQLCKVISINKSRVLSIIQ